MYKLYEYLMNSKISSFFPLWMQVCFKRRRGLYVLKTYNSNYNTYIASTVFLTV